MKAIWKMIGGLAMTAISFLAFIKLFTIIVKLNDAILCLWLIIPALLMVKYAFDCLKKRSKKTG